MRRKLQIAAILLFVIGTLLGACTLPSSASDVSEQSTLDAISDYVRQTSTAVAALQQNPNASVETAQAEATTQAQSVSATQAAIGALSAEDQAATATAVAPILAELPTYGVDPAAGRIGWIHPPVTLEVEGFMQYDYVNYFISTLAADFVVSADITWDAIGSASGCGFVFRSDGNEDALNQYLAILTRVASGPGQRPVHSPIQAGEEANQAAHHQPAQGLRRDGYAAALQQRGVLVGRAGEPVGQHLGGAIMLTVGGVVYLLGGLALTAGLLRTRGLDGAGRA